MTIVIASALGMMFLIERLQKIDINQNQLFSWLSLSLPIVFISLNYGLIRIYASLIIIFWFLKFFFIKENGFSKTSKSELTKNFLISIIIALLILVILNKENFLSLIYFPTFIIPSNAETFFMSKIRTDEQVLSLSNTIFINLKILFYSITGLQSKFNESLFVNQIIGYRHPILNPLISFFFIYGFFICIFNIFKKFQKSYKYLFLIILFYNMLFFHF